ncbi:MAG: hypothetical protein CVU89_06770 [Firmicutes bacterium HGW-Firmicutes-14]|nr:MAG: hypothetical protein CVU89_06770 [Firmicutes bacterium HGW-Firmicutes-14]
MKIAKYLNNQKGLTLVEVIAAVLLLSLVTVSLWAVYDYSTRSYKWGGEYADNQDQGRLVMQKITKAVRNGFKIHTVDTAQGFRLEVLTDNKLADSFDDERIWTGKGTGSFDGTVKREKNRFTVTMNRGVAGSVYHLDTSGPFALVKPTVKGHLHVETKIDGSSLKPGSRAVLYLIGPTTEDGLTVPNEKNFVGVRLDGSGVLNIVENMNGNGSTVWTYDKPVDLSGEHLLRLVLEPRGYNEFTQWVTLYLDNTEIPPIELVKHESWSKENSLAFVRLGLETQEDTGVVSASWSGLSLFYNSFSYFSENKELYYRKNQEQQYRVADGLDKFTVRRDSSKPNLAEIELSFMNRNPDNKQNSSYNLKSSVTFHGR